MAERNRASAHVVAANLLVPGSGLVLLGATTTGTLIAIAFAASANLSIAATLIVPDDVSALWRSLAIGVTLGVYAGAQLRLAQFMRKTRRDERARRRTQALRAVRYHLEAGEAGAARRALEPIEHLADRDLLVAHRRAQVLTACGEHDAARAAWSHLRRLDRHRLYAAEIDRHLSRSPHPREA